MVSYGRETNISNTIAVIVNTGRIHNTNRKKKYTIKNRKITRKIL